MIRYRDEISFLPLTGVLQQYEGIPTSRSRLISADGWTAFSWPHKLHPCKTARVDQLRWSVSLYAHYLSLPAKTYPLAERLRISKELTMTKAKRARYTLEFSRSSSAVESGQSIAAAARSLGMWIRRCSTGRPQGGKLKGADSPSKVSAEQRNQPFAAELTRVKRARHLEKRRRTRERAK